MFATEVVARRRKRRGLQALAGLAITLTLAAGCSGSATTADPPTPSPTVAPRGVAVLGDSFSAGNGAGDYLPGTDASGNHCMRSRNAYGTLLDAERSMGTLTFAACSGATTSDLLHPNHEHYVDPATRHIEPAQITAVPVHAKTVILTIGGNDSGFSSVLARCVTGHFGPITVFPHLPGFGAKGSCHSDDSLHRLVSTRLQALAAAGTGSGAPTAGAVGTPIVAVSELLKAIHSRAPQAHIYLLGYPALFGSFSGSCRIGTVKVTHVPLIGSVHVGITISAADARWLNAVAGQLNAALKTAATSSAAARIPATFVDVSPVFEGHRLCDPDPRWIAPVTGSANLKSRTADLDPSAFHPTESGQRSGYERALLAARVG